MDLTKSTEKSVSEFLVMEKMYLYKNKKIIYYAITGCILFFAGCAKSLINIDTKPDDTTYSMYGREPGRNFYIPLTITDSISLKWQAELNGNFSASTVAIHDHFVFLNDLSGRVFCFDINTGKTVGQLKHKGAVYTTPVIKDLTLIYTYAKNNDETSALVVYNFVDGKLITESENILGKSITDILKIEDGVVFVTENGRIYKFNFMGNQGFEYQTKCITHSNPSLNKDILIFGTDKGEVIGFNIQSQQIIFKNKISNNVLAGVSISDTVAFLGDYNGVLYALGTLSGNIIWKYDTKKRIDMVPAFDNENIYIGNLGGEMFSINKHTGALNWKLQTDGLLNASPLVTDNMLVVPDLNNQIHFVNKSNGVIHKSLFFEGRVKLSPVYFDSLLFVGYDDGILEAYELIN